MLFSDELIRISSNKMHQSQRKHELRRFSEVVNSIGAGSIAYPKSDPITIASLTIIAL